MKEKSPSHSENSNGECLKMDGKGMEGTGIGHQAASYNANRELYLLTTTRSVNDRKLYVHILSAILKFPTWKTKSRQKRASTTRYKRSVNHMQPKLEKKFC